MKNVADPEVLKENKGSGFGLMNCKGIIEKYKKTNPVFNVCLFNVKSTLGQGSRFYFRLPAGVRRVLTAILLVFSLGMVSCSKATDNDVLKETLDTNTYGQTKGRGGSYSVNFQQSGRDVPYLFVKSSVALNLSCRR